MPPPEDRDPPPTPPRLLFRSARLKVPEIQASYAASLEHHAQKLPGPLSDLKTKALTGLITPQSFADQFNNKIIETLHRSADQHLSRAQTRNKNPTNPACGAQVPHSHSDPQRMTLSKELANTRNALRTARKSITLNTDIPRLGRCVVVAKHALRTHIHQQRQTLFNHMSSSEINTASSSRNLWSLLRSYKTNHATSRLPLKIYSNASTDTRLWTKGPLTSDPLA